MTVRLSAQVVSGDPVDGAATNRHFVSRRPAFLLLTTIRARTHGVPNTAAEYGLDSSLV
jgi:hypothetical protein